MRVVRGSEIAKTFLTHFYNVVMVLTAHEDGWLRELSNRRWVQVWNMPVTLLVKHTHRGSTIYVSNFCSSDHLPWDQIWLSSFQFCLKTVKNRRMCWKTNAIQIRGDSVIADQAIIFIRLVCRMFWRNKTDKSNREKEQRVGKYSSPSRLPLNVGTWRSCVKECLKYFEVFRAH